MENYIGNQIPSKWNLKIAMAIRRKGQPLFPALTSADMWIFLQSIQPISTQEDTQIQESETLTCKIGPCLSFFFFLFISQSIFSILDWRRYREPNGNNGYGAENGAEWVVSWG